MNKNYLSQSLSQICGVTNNTPQYIFPTIKNLAAGNYYSEILDVQEVLQSDGSLEAMDFYHRLTDSNGNVIYSRFRYYEKELPGLATSLQQYPQVQTWQDTVGLKEDVTVAPKLTGNYMRIAARTACLANVNAIAPVAPPSSATSPTVPSASATSSAGSSASVTPAKRGGLSSRLSSKHSKPVQTSRQALIADDDDDEFADFDDFLEESDE